MGTNGLASAPAHHTPDPRTAGARQAAGRYMAGVFDGSSARWRAVSAAARARALPALPYRPEARRWAGSATRSRCCCSTCSARSPSTRLQRLQSSLPLNPQALAGVSARTPRSTPRSASSPTPTGRATRGESTMSYLTQMLGLAVQNFLSAATGIAVAIALIRGFARHSAQDHRQFLGRPYPRRRCTCCCRCRCCSRWRWSARASCRTSTPTRTRRRSSPSPIDSRSRRGRQSGQGCARATPVTETADDETQTLPMGPVGLAGSPSSSSAPTAAASSTPIRRIRSRIRRR